MYAPCTLTTPRRMIHRMSPSARKLPYDQWVVPIRKAAVFAGVVMLTPALLNQARLPTLSPSPPRSDPSLHAPRPVIVPALIDVDISSTGTVAVLESEGIQASAIWDRW